MQTDNNLLFVGGAGSGTLTITSSAVSTDPLDLGTGLFNTGSTYVQVPLTIGNATVFGEDLGIGPMRFDLAAFTGTGTPSGGTSLTVAFQGAVDASSGSYPANLSGLTWTTYAQTGAIPLASLSASAQLTLFEWPHRQIKAAMPRFIRLTFTPSGTFSGLTIISAGMFMPAYHNPVGLYPSGFSVGA